MNNLNKVISNVAYILDSLTLLRQIQQTGDCNVCKNRGCGYMPKVGQMVRYNCPFYKVESEEEGDLISRQEAIDANPSSFSRDHENDLISRQAAKKALEDRFMELQKRHSAGKYETNFCLNTILELPSINPQEMKIGKWILSGGYWRCSECKEKALLKLDKAKGHCKEYAPVRSVFCPNCGTKMVELQESEVRNDRLQSLTNRLSNLYSH